MRAMLKEAGLPLEFWDDAVEHDAYIRNLTDTGPIIDGSVVSPHEAYTGVTPSIDHIKVWGHKAFAYIHPKTIPANQRHDKLRDTARVGVFMGFTGNTTKHFKVYCPELGYVQRFNRVLVDENVKGGTIDLKLRGASGPKGTSNVQPDRQPRGRPKNQPNAPGPSPVQTPTKVASVVEKPAMIPQVVIEPFKPPPGIVRFDENDNRIPDPVPESTVSGSSSEESIPIPLTERPNGVELRGEEPEPESRYQESSGGPIDAMQVDPSPDNLDQTIVEPPLTPVPQILRRSKRKRSNSEPVDVEKRLHKIIKAMIAQVALGELDDELDSAFPAKDFESAFPASEIMGIRIPTTYGQAVNDPKHGYLWKEAIIEELRSLMENGTWEEVVAPKGVNIVTSKWVFTIKTLAAGIIDRFKARLVARGFSQVQGEDYNETFAPTARMDTLRMFLAMVAVEDLECSQYDIKNAFTESHLKEKIYMAPPPGLGVKKGRVLAILRSLYGLKQAARDWNLLLKSELIKWGFKQSLADPCLFIHKNKSVKLLVYVDDIVAAAKTKKELDWFYKTLSKRFKAKDLGEIHKILGVRVARDRKNKSIYLDQQEYLETVLKECGFATPSVKSKCHPSADYAEYSPTTDDDIRIDTTKYQSVIGKLMYAMILTRPDIAFALGKLSQHMSGPCERHGRALKKLMRYLISTVTQKLRYGPGGAYKHFVVYSDADWAGDKTDRKSVSGHVVMFYGGPIAWGSKKQKSVATSSCESEYMAIAMCGKQGQWIAQVFRDLSMGKYIGENPNTVHMLGDNQGSLALVKNPHLHERSKHIDICYHYIRDLSERSKLDITYIPTEKMAADGMTKPLQKPGFLRFKGLLGLVD